MPGRAALRAATVSSLIRRVKTCRAWRRRPLLVLNRVHLEWPDMRKLLNASGESLEASP